MFKHLLEAAFFIAFVCAAAASVISRGRPVLRPQRIRIGDPLYQGDQRRRRNRPSVIRIPGDR